MGRAESALFLTVSPDESVTVNVIVWLPTTVPACTWISLRAAAGSWKGVSRIATASVSTPSSTLE